MIDAKQRSQNARLAALTRAASEDVTAMTSAARSAFIESFRPGGKRGGPDIPGLAEAERIRRGEARRRAWYIGLSRKAAEARRRAS
jgi:hypothetical protein